MCSSGIPHVRWRLDRGDILQDGVDETNDTNDGTWDDAVPTVADDYGANKDVDCKRSVQDA